MSDAAKKPDLKFDEKTAVMTDAGLNPTLNLSVDDDVIDENFSFDQKTVVQPQAKPAITSAPVLAPAAAVVPTPPPVAEPVKATADALTGSFKIATPKITPPKPSETPSPVSAVRSKGAVKIGAPVAPEIPPGEEFEFEKKKKIKANQKNEAPLTVFQNFLKNKRALAGIGTVFVLFVIFGVWKSHQPRKLDLHLDENSSSAPTMHELTPQNPTAEIPTAEQAAARFETVFQKVQSESGDVSR